MSQREKKVVLQVDVKESTRKSLRMHAINLGTTMGALADELLSEGLKKIEEQGYKGNFDNLE